MHSKKHHHDECACRAEHYLQELRAQLRSIPVPDWLIKSVGGSVARKAKQNGGGNSFDSVRDALSTVRFTEEQAMELIEIIGDHTK